VHGASTRSGPQFDRPRRVFRRMSMRGISMRRRLRLVAVLLTVGLVVAACGSDRDDDSASEATTPGSTDGSTTTAPAAEEEMFGDLPSPCGEGDASSASDRGVTADTITIDYD